MIQDTDGGSSCVLQGGETKGQGCLVGGLYESFTNQRQGHVATVAAVVGCGVASNHPVQCGLQGLLTSVDGRSIDPVIRPVPAKETTARVVTLAAASAGHLELYVVSTNGFNNASLGITIG